MGLVRDTPEAWFGSSGAGRAVRALGDQRQGAGIGPMRGASFPESGAGRGVPRPLCKGGVLAGSESGDCTTVPVSRCVSDGALVFSLQREGEGVSRALQGCHRLS